MRKALLIGLIICVLAMGGIGAAFATGMGFPGSVGALSTGAVGIPQVDVDGITWGVNNIYPDAYVDAVRLSFDRDLGPGTELGLTVIGPGSIALVNVWVALSDLDQYDPTPAKITPTPVGLDKANSVKIEFFDSLGGFPYGEKVSDVYGIRVIVSEETT